MPLRRSTAPPGAGRVPDGPTGHASFAGPPLLPARAAAALLGVSGPTFVSWAYGARRPVASINVQVHRPILTTVGRGPNQPDVPLAGLVEGHLYAAAQLLGVDPERLARTVGDLAGRIGAPHLLSGARFAVSAAPELARVARERDEATLLAPLFDGDGFSAPFAAALGRIDYDTAGVARRLALPVTTRPVLAVTAGDEIVRFVASDVGLPDVVAGFRAGRSLHDLAEECRCPVTDLEDLIRVGLLP